MCHLTDRGGWQKMKKGLPFLVILRHRRRSVAMDGKDTEKIETCA